MKHSVLMVPVVILLLFFSCFTLAARTVSASPSVVINEFELNPPGDDYAPGAEFVELYNPGPTPVDISGWKISSTHNKTVTVTILSGLGIPAKGFYIVTHTTQWLDNEDESIVLKDAAGTQVENTTKRSDPYNDNRTWQRYPDGASTWHFAASTRATINVPEFSAPTLIMTIATVSAFLLVRKRKR